LSNLPIKPRPHQQFRDPRVERDGFHDMRMPPYMRDSDQNSLSITYRQYAAILELMALEKAGRHGPNSKKTDTPSRRRIAQFRERYWKAPKEKLPKKKTSKKKHRKNESNRESSRWPKREPLS
jgi:hypothetical protein